MLTQSGTWLLDRRSMRKSTILSNYQRIRENRKALQHLLTSLEWCKLIFYECRCLDLWKTSTQNRYLGMCLEYPRFSTISFHLVERVQSQSKPLLILLYFTRLQILTIYLLDAITRNCLLTLISSCFRTSKAQKCLSCKTSLYCLDSRF